MFLEGHFALPLKKPCLCKFILPKGLTNTKASCDANAHCENTVFIYFSSTLPFFIHLIYFYQFSSIFIHHPYPQLSESSLTRVTSVKSVLSQAV